MDRKNIFYGIIFAIIFALLIIGVYNAINSNIDSNYLLTVVATVGALGGIAFALYGWYSSKEIPKLIEKEVEKRISEIKADFEEKQYEQQEALQKMNAVYQIEDTDQKIDLLEKILEIDPKTYNANITMAYTYWYEKDNIDKAEEYFFNELEYHPDNYQAACDLVALYTANKEWRLALKWMKKALEINNNTWNYFENDDRLDNLRKNRSEKYNKIIKSAKE